MSADYWSSSQRLYWTFSTESLAETRRAVVRLDLKYGSEAAIHSWDGHVRIFLFGLVQTLGKRLNLRQRVLATAHTNLLRVYTQVSIYEINPFVLVTTCVYVACKAEEYPQHIRTVANESRLLWAELMPMDTTIIAECEFYLIDILRSCLVTYHAYRSLQYLSRSMQDYHESLALSAEERQGIWAMINDCYACDIPLLYSPHVISTAALYMTLVLRPQLARPPRPPDKLKARIEVLSSYLGVSEIDLEKVAECVQEFVSLYCRWETYNELVTKDLVLKTLKA